MRRYQKTAGVLLAAICIAVTPGCDRIQDAEVAAATATSEEELVVSTTEPDKKLDTSVLDQSGENFEIYTNEERTVFQYKIYDNNGNIMDIGYHNWRGSFGIWMEEDGILTLEYGNGGIPATWYRRYYDTQTGAVSRFFYKPIAADQHLVAYFDYIDGEITLIVQNMFEPTAYSLEIDRDFSDRVIQDQCEAEFLCEGTQLSVTYWVTDNETVSEIIDLT